MNPPLSEQQLAEIAARAEAATEGPWEPYPDYGLTFFANIRGEYMRGVGDINFGVGEQADADFAFVLAARQDVPALLSEVKRLRAALDQTENDLTGARLSLWEEEQDTARLWLAWGSARMRSRRKAVAVRKLKAQVAGLLAERQEKNEWLEDVAKSLRARNDQIAELEGRLFQVGLAPTYRLESGKKFIYVEDIAEAVLGRPTEVGAS